MWNVIGILLLICTDWNFESGSLGREKSGLIGCLIVWMRILINIVDESNQVQHSG